MYFLRVVKRMLPNLVTKVSRRRSRLTELLAVGFIACGMLVAGQVAAQESAAQKEDASQACPNLSEFYPVVYFANFVNIDANNAISETTVSDTSARESALWKELATTLAEIQSSCLRSSEYYALLGAAQLNSAQLDKATEALERALLLDPNNGAAQIDFAAALFASGQLFPALQLNETVLSRADLPGDLRGSLVKRGTDWRKNTRQHSLQLDLLGGYDNNLNGAPGADQITLTLSGEPVLLSLNTDLRPQEGAFANVRLSSRQQKLSANGQRSWTNEVRGRVSQDTRSDLLQFDTRYSLIKPTRRRTVQWEAGASSLFFGGSALYTAAHTRVRYQPNTSNRCAPVYEVASQYQRFHSQVALDAWESKATVGASCVAGTNAGNALRFGFDGGYITNKALDSRRPGDNRDGWQVNARIQRPLFRGELTAQASYTRLNDDTSYSAILANGAARWQERNQLLVQHRTPLRLGNKNALIMINFYHQDQASNIELFELSDTAVEIGISIAL